MSGIKMRGTALLTALLMLWVMTGPALAAETAATMQLAKVEGTVSVTNASGRGLTLMDNMRLYNGYCVETKASSYAWVSLDSAKLAKLDAASLAEVRKNGSKLEVLLKSGNIFFNVSEPLASNETLNIRTSTAIVGIRGTSGWVNMPDEGTVEVYILEGTVECVVTDPVSGETGTVTVSGGEMMAFSTGGDSGSETVHRGFNENDIQGFVLAELLQNEALCDEILERSGLDVRLVADEAQERLAAEEAATNQRLEEAAQRQAGQTSNVSTDPLWNGSSAGVPVFNYPTVVDPAPTSAPEPTATPEPTAVPTPEPTAAAASPEPTSEPIPSPTSDPTPEITQTPSPSPEPLDSEPVESIPDSEPVESIPDSEPVESIPDSEPVESIPDSEPVESIPDSEPVESIPDSEPVESVPDSEPVESIPDSEPVESAADGQSLPSSGAMASAVSAAGGEGGESLFGSTDAGTMFHMYAMLPPPQENGNGKSEGDVI